MLSNELVARALARAVRLKTPQTGKTLRISRLFELLRLRSYGIYNETVADATMRATGPTGPNEPRGSHWDPAAQAAAELARLSVLTFSELRALGAAGAQNIKTDASGASTAPTGAENCFPPDEFPAPRGGAENPPVVEIFGWVKSVRRQAANTLVFLVLNDGSCRANLQVVVHDGAVGFAGALRAHSGASVVARGLLVDRQNLPHSGEFSSGGNENALPHGGQEKFVSLETISNQYELHVSPGAACALQIVGENLSPHKYPIAKRGASLEFLREVAHLRPRSYLISAVMRVRSALAAAVHLFFQRMGCNYLHTPLITSADCEGAGELFQVTTMFDGAPTAGALCAKLGVKTPTAANGASCSNGGAENSPAPCGAGEVPINFAADFFKRPAYLTCSGQLSAENFCCSMGSVYTFGPTFRAENSHTSRHLAEFWMVEPELVGVDLVGLMKIAEEFVKFLVNFALKHCRDDLLFLSSLDVGLVERLQNIVNNEFVHLSYSDAIEILKEYVMECGPDGADENSARPTGAGGPIGTPFEFSDITWGMDLQSEHERFLAERVFQRPVIIFNYPREIKAFYMRQSGDGTVKAMDLIVPGIGELIGGSEREERLDVLEREIARRGLSPSDYWWYADLRRYGTVTHSGFGLGFERLVMLVTGVTNIRDVIPFPRYAGHADF